MDFKDLSWMILILLCIQFLIIIAVTRRHGKFLNEFGGRQYFFLR